MYDLAGSPVGIGISGGFAKGMRVTTGVGAGVGNGKGVGKGGQSQCAVLPSVVLQRSSMGQFELDPLPRCRVMWRAKPPVEEAV